MSQTSLDPLEEAPEYTRWRRKADLLANSGRFQEALEACDEVAAWAEAQQEARYRDQAFCWRAAILVALGEGEKVAPRLRRILMSHAHPIPQLLAAHHLSAHHDRRGETEKSLSYASRALRHARDYGLGHHMVRCLNRYANAMWQGGDYAGAGRVYSEALEWLTSSMGESEGMRSDDPVDDWSRGVLMANLGSSLVLQDKAQEGLGQLASAYACIDSQPAILRSEALLRRIQLGMSFGYLHLERPLVAGQYASEALREQGGPIPQDVRKGGLFLLGEANKFAGSEDMACHYFSCLQEEFYPDMPDVVDLLLFTDARQLINPWT